MLGAGVTRVSEKARALLSIASTLVGPRGLPILGIAHSNIFVVSEAPTKFQDWTKGGSAYLAES